MKKLLKLDKDIYGELSLEEVLVKYNNVAYSQARKFVSLYTVFELEEIHQILKIVIWTSYDSYDVKRDIGFGHFLKTNIKNKLMRIVRDYSFPVRKIIYHTESYNKTINDDDNRPIEILETFSDDTDYADLCINNVFMRDVLNKLNAREKGILLGYYIDDTPQRVLAERYGVTQVQISRILRRITKQIRKEAI